MGRIRTHRLGIIALGSGLRSGLAVSQDVLDVANRAALALDPTAHPPFEALVLHPGDALPPGLAGVILPGMGCADGAELDAVLDSDEGRWAVALLRAAGAAGLRIATSCAGVFVAAAAGVLDGRTATTSWFLEAELTARHPAIEVNAECVLIESGLCLTGGAALAHADVMLAVVERLAGPPLADLCARYLLLDRRRSQRPYMILSALVAGDPQLVRAERWIRAHLAEPFYVADVAAAVGLGARTFARRLQRTCGLSPIRFIQRIRVDVAGELIAAGLSVEAAAPRVGYGDATALRRVLRKHGR